MRLQARLLAATLALYAALLLWVALRLILVGPLRGGRSGTVAEPMDLTTAETAGAHPRRPPWLLALAGVATVALCAVSLTLALGADDGPAPSPAREARLSPSGDSEEAAFDSPAMHSATPTPLPAGVSLVPGYAGGSVGGDQPSAGQPAPAIVPIPENVNVSEGFLGLRDALAAEIADYQALVGSIEVAIAVTDLQTGQTISVNGNNLQRTGCTINMYALFAAVDQFQSGAASPSSVAYDIKVGIGGSYPPEVKRFLQTIFGDHEVGVVRARELMAAWGLRSSLFDHVPYYGDGTQSNYLTALETNLTLVKLFRGELFDPEWTAYTLERLRDIKWGLNYILPGRLPYAATVAHKIGYYWEYDGWVNNDVGIVTFTGGDGQEKAYAISYLSQKAYTEYTGYSFGATLSRIVWDWFEANYSVTPPPPPEPPPPEPSATPEPTPAPTTSPAPTPTP